MDEEKVIKILKNLEFDDYFTFDYNMQRIRKIIDVNILKLFCRF